MKYEGLFKDRGKLNKKKMRFDDGRGGAGKLTSSVSRLRMWKQAFLCSQSLQGAGLEQPGRWQNHGGSSSGQTHRPQRHGTQVPTLILPFLNLAKIG